MNDQDIKRISKFLSLILRHKPEKIGLQLDANGWANVEELLSKSRKNNRRFTLVELEEIIEKNDKKRFTFNEGHTMIRANQGHSLKTIDLQLEAIVPPAFLYHGTVPKFLDSIRIKGLQKMNRQHVHLSKDRATATIVGNRRGKATILKIRTEDMHRAGFSFYCSKNGVWLTDNVPSGFIDLG